MKKLALLLLLLTAQQKLVYANTCLRQPFGNMKISEINNKLNSKFADIAKKLSAENRELELTCEDLALLALK